MISDDQKVYAYQPNNFPMPRLSKTEPRFGTEGVHYIKIMDGERLLGYCSNRHMTHVFSNDPNMFYDNDDDCVTLGTYASAEEAEKVFEQFEIVWI